MLTRKQRWRRVRGGRPEASSCAFDGSICSSAATHRPPRPIDSLSIGDSLLQLLGSNTAPARGSRGRDGSPRADTAGAESRGGACDAAVPAAKPPARRVRFNYQVRVVLVPSRSELDFLKGDIWWAEEDYSNFRREYILAMRALAQGEPAEQESMLEGKSCEDTRQVQLDSPTLHSLPVSSPPPSQPHHGPLSRKSPLQPPSGVVLAAAISPCALAAAAAASAGGDAGICSSALQHPHPQPHPRCEGSDAVMAPNTVVCSVAEAAAAAAAAAESRADLPELLSETDDKKTEGKEGDDDGKAAAPAEAVPETTAAAAEPPLHPLRRRPPLAPRSSMEASAAAVSCLVAPATVVSRKMVAGMVDDDGAGEDDGYRTQSMSSVSDQTDLTDVDGFSASDSDADDAAERYDQVCFGGEDEEVVEKGKELLLPAQPARRAVARDERTIAAR